MIDLKTFQNLNSVVVGNFKPKPTSISENQEGAAVQLWVSEDGNTKIGVWECTPGEFTTDRGKEAEYCHILSGSASVRIHNDSHSRNLGSREPLFIPISCKGSWIIHEHERKLYVLQSP